MKKTIAAALALAFLTIAFSGCLMFPFKKEVGANTIVPEPESLEIKDFDSLAGDLLLPEDAYEAVPLFAPLFKNHGTRVAIGKAPEGMDFGEAEYSQTSLFSSMLALAHYGKGGGNGTVRAVVVDSYENTLRAGTLAWLLDAPILVYGKSTDEALWRLGAHKPENVMLIGGFREDQYSSGAGSAPVFRTGEEILNETLSVAAEKGVGLSYISVVNPCDEDEMESYYKDNMKSPFTPHLSCFGSMFAALRDGVTITVEPVPETIDKTIHAAADSMSAAGMTPTHLLMLGDSISLPFVYYWVPGYDGGNDPGVPLYGSVGQVPTDNVYGDLEELSPEYNQSEVDGTPIPETLLTVELANGRVIARDLGCLTDYFYRMACYNERLAATSGPAEPQPLMGEEWNNNAFAYHATRAEFGAPEEVEGWMMLLQEGKFNAEEGSAYGHLGAEGIGVAGGYLAEKFAAANFIIAGADHGCPEGNSVSISELLPMPPNINFQISCMTGQIDNHNDEWEVTKDASYTYAMLENGVATYIAAMRSTFGTTPPSLPNEEAHSGSSGEFSYFFFEELIGGDCTVGQALANAKARLTVDIPSDETVGHGNENVATVIKLEYELYGDPAFNPYEPCNEGTNYGS
ncbi:MAG: hypothetical protein CVT48_03700 [Thermoplasmata archaeon HGW-Thermoplasmata-1]|nr:MAG: hypothetical protein CVT48_03700 [Thermoplasmata archaeon HGW-Thermoplasmata-1]